MDVGRKTSTNPRAVWLSPHGIFESTISDDEKQGSKVGFGNKGVKERVAQV